jgi:hypothetical protein
MSQHRPHRNVTSRSPRVPIVEPGLPIEPEDLGVHFLRDATEENPFDPSAALELRGEAGLPSAVVEEAELSELPIDDDSLGEADEFDTDELDADDLDTDELELDADALEDMDGLELDDPLDVLERELAAREGEVPADAAEADGVDLRSPSIRGGSLFNRPLDADESESEDEDELLEENATLEPHVQADDVSAPDTRRQRLIQRRRDALLARRLGAAKPSNLR